MNQTATFAPCEVRYELRYAGLFNRGRGYSFPCDAEGHVNIDELSARCRLNYLYARALVGVELSAPFVSQLA